MLQLFKHHTTAAFAHNKTIAVLVERPRSRQRIVVAERQGMHGVESANACLTDTRLGTAGYHSHGLAVTNQIETGDDGMR